MLIWYEQSELREVLRKAYAKEDCDKRATVKIGIDAHVEKEAWKSWIRQEEVECTRIA